MLQLRSHERSLIRILAVLGLVGMTAAACGSPTFVDRSQPRQAVDEVPAPILDAVVFNVDPALLSEPPDCVAVLPFTRAAVSNGAHEDGNVELEKVRRAFHAHLAPQTRRDVELWKIDAVLAVMAETRRTDYATLGKALGCDTVLEGSVTEYQRFFLGLYSRVEVGADVRLIRTRDDTVLWEGSHRAASHGGNVPMTLPGIAFGVLDAATNMRGEQVERVADDLARRLVSTIPDPPAADMIDPETIRVLAAAGALRDPSVMELSDFATAAGTDSGKD